MRDVRAIESIGREDADKDYRPNTWHYTSDAVMIECLGLPETWEIVGRVFKEVDIDPRENYQEWVVVEHSVVFANTKHLVVWDDNVVPYRLKFRFVEYLRDCSLIVTEISYEDVVTPEVNSPVLDDIPGGTAFAIEKVYSSFSGQPVLLQGISVNEVASQIDDLSLKLLPVDIVSSDGNFLYGSDSAYLTSDVSTSVGPEFLYATRFRVLGSYEGQIITIFKCSNNLDIRVKSDSSLRARTRSTGGFVDITSPSFSFDVWHTLVYKVEQSSVELWLDGNLLGSTIPSSPLMSASAKLRLELMGIELKAGVVWQAPAVIPDAVEVGTAISLL